MYRLEIKESLGGWFVHYILSKVLWLHSFQIVQNMQKGVVLQAFHLFFPVKLSFQHINKSFTKYRRIHKMPSKENRKCHYPLAFP